METKEKKLITDMLNLLRILLELAEDKNIHVFLSEEVKGHLRDIIQVAEEENL